MDNAYTIAKDDLTDLSTKLRACEDSSDTAKGDGVTEALEHLLRGKDAGLSDKEAMIYAEEKIHDSLDALENDPAYGEGLLEGMDIIHDEFRVQYATT